MLNTVNLIGRLTSSPELAKTSNDKSYARVTLAVNRRFKNKEGEREADFVSIVFWGTLAEHLISYAKKGMLLSVEGTLRAYSFENKQNERKYVTEVLGLSFDLLESRAAVAMRESGSSKEDIRLEAEEMPF